MSYSKWEDIPDFSISQEACQTSLTMHDLPPPEDESVPDTTIAYTDQISLVEDVRKIRKTKEYKAAKDKAEQFGVLIENLIRKHLTENEIISLDSNIEELNKTIVNTLSKLYNDV
eukprot:TRINITY_DN7379_c0_g1_i1.p1 TRINITY_DN7379_c0_g1~~TRINITY_DN7379_c0_g1_i1.p1  ORF type:complete len:115 (+),score=19.03 TRINITY_DN7379_c0_g1_i1:134-478(+)